MTTSHWNPFTPDRLGLEYRAALPVGGVAFRGMGDVIRAGSQAFIDTTTNLLDVQLGDLLASTEASTGRSFGAIVQKIGDAEVTISYLSGALAYNLSAPFDNVNNWVKDTWAPAFKKNVKDAFEEARNKGYKAGKSEAQERYSRYSPMVYYGPTTPAGGTQSVSTQMQQMREGVGMSTATGPGGVNIGTRTDIGQKAVESYLEKYFAGL